MNGIVNTAESKVTPNSHYVVVILQAKSGQESNLKQELLKVQKLSLQEATCLGYKVHEDINNPAQFVLYEEWTSQEDHAKQFVKDYIIALGNVLKDILAQPYICVLGK